MAVLDKLLAKKEKLDQEIYVAKNKERQSERKVLVKQKILLGSYLLNKFDKMDVEEKKAILNEIRSTTSEKRISDNKAIDDLFKKI